MNSKSLKILEYDKIINILASFATSFGGRKLCLKLLPMSDINKIRSMQQNTTDALNRILRHGKINFNDTKEILDSLKRLDMDASLSIRELLDISSLLSCVANAKMYQKNCTETNSDSLDKLFNNLETLTTLNNKIKKCITSEDNINDEASSTLSNIRRQIKHLSNQIHVSLNSIINSATIRTYLQDSVITMRNDRYCIPVKTEYKNLVQGMIHDQSQSGSTTFIEPMSVVKLNNEIKELKLKEIEEINRILFELSSNCADYIRELKNNYDILIRLDYIFAKALFSKEIKGSEPMFNNDKYIELKNARHPLIDSKVVVPITVNLGREYNLLVVTGPNTGGKTCSLKTIGLLNLMGQSGLHIPADEGSSLGVFNEIYADIGDEQSIEQNLSTFSSHMTNIVHILNNADSDSLVLFDELCAGTDPIEGAALAISILEFLHNLGIDTVATTHYSELKTYALDTDGVINCCLEFDVETLKPTYRLLIGVPGKSNAFSISSKLGLSDFIIEDAKTRIDNDAKRFEDAITDLEQSKFIIEDEKNKINEYKKEIDSLKAEIKTRKETLDKKQEEIVNKAKEEALQILKEAKEYADKTIRDINKLSKSGDNQALENARRNARKQMDKMSGSISKKKTTENVPKKKLSKKDLHIGDKVKVLSMNVEGTIHTLPDNAGNMVVQMGILSSRVNINDIILIDEGPVISKNSSSGASKIAMSKSLNISPEIKLLGMTSDEAVSMLDKYLDDAYLSHLSSVRIVHGKGSGALRNAVWNYLKRCNYISEYKLAEYGEGDAGVTIATFKK